MADRPSKPARPFFALTINWCIAAVSMAVAYVVCYSVPLSQMAPDPGLMQLHLVARSIAMLLLTLSALSAVLLVIGVLACLKNPEVPGAYIAWVGFACVTPFLAYVTITQLTWPMHRHALERVAATGASVARRVELETATLGAPPKRIEHAPTTLSAYPEFSYTVFERRDAKRTLWWYDLGARHGRTVTSTWTYPDGEPGHAILAFEIDGDGNIAHMQPDRMTVDARAELWNAEAWARTPRDRQGMVTNIEKLLDHKTGYAVLAMLGEPDGERVLIDTPWELSVHTWPNDKDRFFYWPTRAYPTILDGRAITRVGDWAYARD